MTRAEQTEGEAGVQTMVEMQDAIEAARLCRLGYHAWVPWLTLPCGSFTTWCARAGCNASEQYDL